MTVVATDNMLLAAPEVRIEAGRERKQPAVSIVAYNGGIMRVPGWNNVVIDLAHLEVTGGVTILSDHDSSRGGVVGHGSAQVLNHRLIVTGVISATGQAAREIVESSKNGFPWEASVGVEVIERQTIRAGQTVEVNGKSIKAPAGGLTLVTQGRLREVSIVGIGCDGDTVVSIAASKNMETNMEVQTQDTEVQDQQRTEAETLEAQRVANIASICGTKYPEIQAKAIEEGWDETRAELEVLRASRPKFPPTWRTETVVATGSVLEAALLTHMGKHELGEKALGPIAMEQAGQMGATSMLDLCRASLQADGRDVPAGRMEMIKAALTTMSLPTALGNVANKVLLDSYSETPASWRAFCATRSTNDFKTNTAIRPTFTGQLEQVAPGGELKHSGITEAVTEFRIDTFGKMLSIDRRDIINDDLSVFEETAAAFGRMAMRRLSDLVFAVLLANEGNFFSVANGNFLDGADSALTIDALANAITLTARSPASLTSPTPPDLATARTSCPTKIRHASNARQTCGSIHPDIDHPPLAVPRRSRLHEATPPQAARPERRSAGQRARGRIAHASHPAARRLAGDAHPGHHRRSGSPLRQVQIPHGGDESSGMARAAGAGAALDGYQNGLSSLQVTPQSGTHTNIIAPTSHRPDVQLGWLAPNDVNPKLSANTVAL